MNIPEECNRLRPILANCRCGADFHHLVFHTWHVGEGASVWCQRCGAGTPMMVEGPRAAQACPYPTAIKIAADLWNEWAEVPHPADWQPTKSTHTQ